ncbi:tagaturonate reductase [Agriterribacter sp.]|uniref:tagaturonate reductase n=1 Tax=Agriterribacter sp. TaxID=2821509 RepID=UPI002C7DDBC0|nr:tagaturonate reductase [Agriterribacter sp.]HRO47473.1 tagaturonate reductase [Agriterribacter sp.]HRQ18612.1 tagaturonate reductase [Agriterribacter sp.]
MLLNKSNLSVIKNNAVQKPGTNVFELPEKVLQFGTGVLLRGLPDYFIDKANRQGIFNGRVVVVKSTGTGGADAFDAQDGLYTLCVRGIDKGEKVEEDHICSAISRVLSATQQWDEVLKCAHNLQLQIIISNTTEVGITLVEEDIRQKPPASFPAKLLAFLYERYKACGGKADGGMVIIPTELIVGNGDQLFSIVSKLAAYNKMEPAFMEWLKANNSFCNSLVDRIVPGKPAAETKQKIEEALGYTDELLIMCEVYRLWAIEGDDKVKKILSFAPADNGVIIAPDIAMYRELKLRLLNGTHTLSCALAFLSGFNTVKDAMEDQAFGQFVHDLMLSEIAPAIPAEVDAEEAERFGLQVLDRFSNPYIRHQWISITMQYTSKMKMRVVPVLKKYVADHNAVPQHIALGFAAYLLFMKAVKKEKDGYMGEWNGKSYPINDDKADYFFEQWKKYEANELVQQVLSDSNLWGTDLSALPLFVQTVQNNLKTLMTQKNIQHELTIKR